MAVILHRRPRAISDIASITTGNVILNSGSFLDVTVPAFTMDKTVLIFTDRSAGTSVQQSISRVTGQITSTTNIRFATFNTSTRVKTIVWFLIEFAATSSATVQRGSFTQVTADDDVTISSVNLSHAFPLCSTRVSAGSNSIVSDAMLKADITTPTNLNLVTKTTSSQVTEWQVVEHLNWNVSTATVTRTSTKTADVTVPAMVLKNIWLVGSCYLDNVDANIKDWSIYYPTSTTNIRLENGDASSDSTFAKYYIVDSKGAFNTQFDETEIPTGSNSIFTAISNIDTAKSIIFGAMSNFNQAIDVNDPISIENNPRSNTIGIEINTATEIRVRRQSSGDSPADVKVAAQIIDFSKSARR